MKFEEALPLMRKGEHFKCGSQSGFYTAHTKSLFGMELGISICNISPEYPSNNIFHWGIDGNSLLSDEWEPYIVEDKDQEINKIESVLGKNIEDIIFRFFMDITRPFTPPNALLPPLSKPITERIMAMLKQFFDEKRLNDLPG